MLVSPTTVDAAYAAAAKDIFAWLAGLRLETKIDGIHAPSTAYRQAVGSCHERAIVESSETDHVHLDRVAAAASAAFQSWSAEAWQTRYGTLKQVANLLLAHRYDLSLLHG